jgi:hypothetical protein
MFWLLEEPWLAKNMNENVCNRLYINFCPKNFKNVEHVIFSYKLRVIKIHVADGGII